MLPASGKVMCIPLAIDTFRESARLSTVQSLFAGRLTKVTRPELFCDRHVCGCSIDLEGSEDVVEWKSIVVDPVAGVARCFELTVNVPVKLNVSGW